MRISWVDNLRWIGILLIVLWHCFFPEKSIFVKYLFSFHVVLFFLLSWLLFNDKKYFNFLDFFKSKFIRLIIPFFLFNIIMFVILKLNWEFSWTTIRDFLVWVFYWDYLWDNGWYMNNKWWFNIINTSTWFLTTLFSTSIFYFVINKALINKFIKIFVLFLISILIFIYSKYSIFRFPWWIEISFMVMLFYWFFHTFRKEVFTFVEKIDYKYLFILPFILWFNLYFLNSTNVSTNYYWNYFMFLVDSLLWFLFFVIISKILWENKILNFLWKNSIIVLWFEWIKFLIIKKISFFSFWYLVYERSYLVWFMQFILTILFIVPIIIIINKLTILIKK